MKSFVLFFFVAVILLLSSVFSGTILHCVTYEVPERQAKHDRELIGKIGAYVKQHGTKLPNGSDVHCLEYLDLTTCSTPGGR